MEQGENTEKIVEQEKVCGIVMPISDCDGMPKTHWADVLRIISDSIEDVKFKPNLVSQNDAVVVIHKTIIQNLYQNPIVVCDVSGKNSNVMFELGIRLAFDKPTIIIKDDRTNYSFDTSPIEHLEYPRDLRFNQIVEFKEKLAQKISKTYNRSINDPDYSTFLKEYGTFKVAKIGTEEVSQFDLFREEFQSIRKQIEQLHYNPIMSGQVLNLNNDDNQETVIFEFDIKGVNPPEVTKFINHLKLSLRDVCKEVSFNRYPELVKAKLLFNTNKHKLVFNILQAFESEPFRFHIINS